MFGDLMLAAILIWSPPANSYFRLAGWTGATIDLALKLPGTVWDWIDRLHHWGVI